MMVCFIHFVLHLLNKCTFGHKDIFSADENNDVCKVLNDLSLLISRCYTLVVVCGGLGC